MTTSSTSPTICHPVASGPRWCQCRAALCRPAANPIRCLAHRSAPNPSTSARSPCPPARYRLPSFGCMPTGPGTRHGRRSGRSWMAAAWTNSFLEETGKNHGGIWLGTRCLGRTGTITPWFASRTRTRQPTPSGWRGRLASHIAFPPNSNGGMPCWPTGRHLCSPRTICRAYFGRHGTAVCVVCCDPWEAADRTRLAFMKWRAGLTSGRSAWKPLGLDVAHLPDAPAVCRVSFRRWQWTWESLGIYGPRRRR